MRVANHLKGRMGEALVAALFQMQGWSVERMGMEHQLHLRGLELDNSRGGKAISELPDLLVHQQRGKQLKVVLIEVKTHRQAPSAESLRRYFRFDGVLVVWVAPTGILASWILQDHDKVPISVQDYQPIAEIPSLNLDATQLGPYDELASRLHGDPPRRPMQAAAALETRGRASGKPTARGVLRAIGR